MAAPIPAVFIPGLWMHATSWDNWVGLFNEAGYRALAPGWPGDADRAEAARVNPEVTVRSAYKIQRRLNSGNTEFRVFPDRSHVVPADNGLRAASGPGAA